MVFGLPLLAAVALVAQSADPSKTVSARPVDPPAARRITATRAAQEVTIDGRDDDAVWREATPITEFREWRPTE